MDDERLPCISLEQVRGDAVLMATATPAVTINVRSSLRAGAWINFGCDIKSLESGGDEMFNLATELPH